MIKKTTWAIVGCAAGFINLLALYLCADEFEISFGISNQTSRVCIPSDTSHYYQIWATENLLSNSWAPTGMTLGVEGTQTWSQSAVTQRFYRAIQIPTDEAEDQDADGLDDVYELNQSLNPLNDDTDGDSLIDGDEVNSYGTDPAQADTDADGLADGNEVIIYATDPTSSDTDGDSFEDGDEVDYGDNPLNGNDGPQRLVLMTLDLYSRWNQFFQTPLVLTNEVGTAAYLDEMDNALVTIAAASARATQQ